MTVYVYVLVIGFVFMFGFSLLVFLLTIFNLAEWTSIERELLSLSQKKPIECINKVIALKTLVLLLLLYSTKL